MDSSHQDNTTVPRRKSARLNNATVENKKVPSRAQQLKLLDYFEKKRGAPKKRQSDVVVTERKHKASKSKAGQNEAEREVAANSKMITSVDPDKVEKQAVKNKRRNYSKGEDYKLMKKAIEDWTEMKGQYFDPKTKFARDLRDFAEAVEIPYKTLRKYLHGAEGKRRKLGCSVGRKPNLTKNQTEFIADVLSRADRANEGKNRKEAVDLVLELNPQLCRSRASKALTNHVLRKSEKVKNSLVVAQSTTTKRSVITIDQQFRWHKTIEYAYGELCSRNKGVCTKTGKSFGEVMQHFIVGGDESCFMVSANGDCRVIGSVGKAKHERNIMDS